MTSEPTRLPTPDGDVPPDRERDEDRAADDDQAQAVAPVRGIEVARPVAQLADRAADDVADADPDRGQRRRETGEQPAQRGRAGRRGTPTGSSRGRSRRGRPRLGRRGLARAARGGSPGPARPRARRCGRTGRHARRLPTPPPPAPHATRVSFRSKRCCLRLQPSLRSASRRLRFGRWVGAVPAAGDPRVGWRLPVGAVRTRSFVAGPSPPSAPSASAYCPALGLDARRAAFASLGLRRRGRRRLRSDAASSGGLGRPARILGAWNGRLRLACSVSGPAARLLRLSGRFGLGFVRRIRIGSLPGRRRGRTRRTRWRS